MCRWTKVEKDDVDTLSAPNKRCQKQAILAEKNRDTASNPWRDSFILLFLGLCLCIPAWIFIRAVGRELEKSDARKALGILADHAAVRTPELLEALFHGLQEQVQALRHEIRGEGYLVRAVEEYRTL